MFQLYDLVSIHNDEFRLEAKRRINKIIDENSFIEGEYNKKFEEEFAEMQGANFCRLVTNGTDALEVSLKAFDIEAGDLVGIPGITFYATAEAVYNVGAIPVLIDVEEDRCDVPRVSRKEFQKSMNLKPLLPFIFMVSHAKWIKLVTFAVPRVLKLLKMLLRLQEQLHRWASLRRKPLQYIYLFILPDKKFICDG